MDVRVYACMCACMYVMYVMYACMHVCMYACMHVCMYACMHVCMYACMQVCMHACMHACMYVCMYVSMCVYMYIFFGTPLHLSMPFGFNSAYFWVSVPNVLLLIISMFLSYHVFKSSDTWTGASRYKPVQIGTSCTSSRFQDPCSKIAGRCSGRILGTLARLMFPRSPSKPLCNLGSRILETWADTTLPFEVFLR